MYCGVPVMTTDVGIVREALGEKQQEYIIGDRENGQNDENIKKILKEKIINLYNNRNILKELSEENLKAIVEYDGGKLIKEFEETETLVASDKPCIFLSCGGISLNSCLSKTKVKSIFLSDNVPV
jgi:glycosyltransferase involved in cell wall biosynthesis